MPADMNWSTISIIGAYTDVLTMKFFLPRGKKWSVGYHYCQIWNVIISHQIPNFFRWQCIQRHPITYTHTYTHLYMCICVHTYAICVNTYGEIMWFISEKLIGWVTNCFWSAYFLYSDWNETFRKLHLSVGKEKAIRLACVQGRL